MSACALEIAAPLSATVLLVLKTQGLFGFQGSMLWGPVSQMGVLKVGMLSVGSKLQLSGRSWEQPPHRMVLCQGCGLWQEHVPAFPTHLDVGIFSFFHCVGVTS